MGAALRVFTLAVVFVFVTSGCALFRWNYALEELQGHDAIPFVSFVRFFHSCMSDHEQLPMKFSARLKLDNQGAVFDEVVVTPDTKVDIEKAIIIESCRSVAQDETRNRILRDEKIFGKSRPIGGMHWGEIYFATGQISPHAWIIYRDRAGFPKGQIGEPPSPKAIDP